MSDTLLWIYIINLTLLINHEIDSAYWKEWRLFKIGGGITFFLILHFPIWFLALFGLIEVYKKTFTGSVCSLVLGGIGFFAFFIHMYFIKKGHDEFKIPISIFILVSTLIVSIVQLVVTLKIMLS